MRSVWLAVWCQNQCFCNILALASLCISLGVMLSCGILIPKDVLQLYICSLCLFLERTCMYCMYRSNIHTVHMYILYVQCIPVARELLVLEVGCHSCPDFPVLVSIEAHTFDQNVLFARWASIAMYCRMRTLTVKHGEGHQYSASSLGVSFIQIEISDSHGAKLLMNTCIIVLVI